MNAELTLFHLCVNKKGVWLCSITIPAGPQGNDPKGKGLVSIYK